MSKSKVSAARQIRPNGGSMSSNKIFLKVLLQLATLPNPEVCRHYIALTILDELERANGDLATDELFLGLVKAFGASSEGDDAARLLCKRSLRA
jgi:hypothetical protein